MACPTCDGTMQAIGCRVTDKNFYWCPRCGTIKTCEGEEAVAPDLVRRCRKYAATIGGVCAEHAFQFHSLGINEAINVPADRIKL